MPARYAVVLSATSVNFSKNLPSRDTLVVDILQALLRHIPGRLLIRLSARRSRVTRDFIAEQGERLWVEYLPGCAPELNPVEYICYREPLALGKQDRGVRANMS